MKEPGYKNFQTIPGEAAPASANPRWSIKAMATYTLSGESFRSMRHSNQLNRTAPAVSVRIKQMRLTTAVQVRAREKVLGLPKLMLRRIQAAAGTPLR